MTAMIPQKMAIDKLCRTTIQEQWGDLADLPKELVDGVLNVYKEFMMCYLNILRQKDNKSSDWIPETVSIEFELVDQMRHFFSDYQHITRNFCKLNHKMEQLLAMGKETHPKLYDDSVKEILARYAWPVTPGSENETDG